MNGINLAKTILNKRRDKGITQDELAHFMGISKSSVSKWETGQSYPDIALLPQLASFFDISLDELMGYEPQMMNEDINKLCNELLDDFSKKPVDDVINRCRDITKKYFSCYQLICRIGLLYTNYGITSKNETQKTSILAEAKELFIRVKTQSNDIQLKQIALHCEATCELMQGNPVEIINLLSDVKPPPPHKVILSQAYLMTGMKKEAKAELQESMFLSIIELFGTLPPHLILCSDDKELFEETYKRGVGLINLFNLKELSPTTILPFYIASAQAFLVNGNTEKALDILEDYTEIVTGDIYPLELVKRDNFFDLIDSHTENLNYGVMNLPRDEKSIKQSMADVITENPAFSALSNELRFIKLTEALINNA